MALKPEDVLNLNVPDDTIIKGADGSDIRWGDLKAGILGLGQERNAWYEEARRHQNEAAKLSESFTTLLNEGTKAAAAEQRAPVANPKDMLKQAMSELLKGDEDKDDPYLSPIIERKAKRMMEDFKEHELQSHVAPLKAQLDEQAKALQLVGGQLGLERGLRLYGQAGEWPDGYDFATATKAAVDNRIFVPGTTYPDYGRLNEQLMGPTRRHRYDEQIRQEERKKVENEFKSQYGANLVMPNRPGMSFPIGKAPIDTTNKTAEQIMDEALRAGIEDAIQEGSINGR